MYICLCGRVNGYAYMYTCMLVWVWVGAYLLLKLEKHIFLLEKNQQISFSENCMMKYKTLNAEENPCGN